MSADQQPETTTLYPRIQGELILRTDDGQEIRLGRATFHSDIKVSLTTAPAVHINWDMA
jgi:hypothetical protein